jgi:hypothetical protein
VTGEKQLTIGAEKTLGREQLLIKSEKIVGKINGVDLNFTIIYLNKDIVIIKNNLILALSRHCWIK